MTTLRLALVAALVGLWAAPATATPINVSSGPGESGLGSYTGSIEYFPDISGVARLELTLTNTSPAANGGYLVAVALNNPGNVLTGVTLSSAPVNFNIVGTAPFQGGINVQPFGAADFGASSASSWIGGGSPNGGIPVGASGTWEFTFTGSNSALQALTTLDFINELSTGGSHAGSLLVRFRGFEDGGSDKVPGTFDPVPEPMTLMLVGSGLGVLAAARRRMQARG